MRVCTGWKNCNRMPEGQILGVLMLYEIENTSLGGLIAVMPRRLWADLRRLVRNHRYEQTEGGIEILHAHFKICGLHDVFVNGKWAESAHNLIPVEGLNHLLDVAMHGSTAVGTWYVAPFSGNITVQSTLTAATFAATTTELTTQYSEATRQAYVETAASSGSNNNTSNPATVTAASSNVTIWGAGILSTSTKGDTNAAPTQICISAAKYSAVKTLSAVGDTFGLKYTVSGTSS